MLQLESASRQPWPFDTGPLVSGATFVAFRVTTADVMHHENTLLQSSSQHFNLIIAFVVTCTVWIDTDSSVHAPTGVSQIDLAMHPHLSSTGVHGSGSSRSIAFPISNFPISQAAPPGHVGRLAFLDRMSNLATLTQRVTPLALGFEWLRIRDANEARLQEGSCCSARATVSVQCYHATMLCSKTATLAVAHPMQQC